MQFARIFTHTWNSWRLFPFWPYKRACSHLTFWTNCCAAKFTSHVFVPLLFLLTFHAVSLRPFGIWYGRGNGWTSCNFLKSIISWKATDIFSSNEQKLYQKYLYLHTLRSERRLNCLITKIRSAPENRIIFIIQ